MKIDLRVEFDGEERLRMTSEIPDDEVNDVIKALVEGLTLYLESVLEVRSPTVENE